MPEAASEPKSPKTPRRLKTGGEPLRQVHFQSGNSKASTDQAQPSANNDCKTTSGGIADDSTTAPDNQPESFPQLGAFPNSTLGPGQWHTSADPTQSVKLPGQLYAGSLPPGFTYAPPNAHFFPVSNGFAPLAPNPPQVTYIGLQHPQLHNQHFVTLPTTTATATMADYQNTAPIPAGVNFQPPVPDTTFGPIPHVYVPRFDGGFVPAGVQVGLPPQPAVGVSVAQPGYVVAQQPAFVPQPIVGQQPIMIGAQPVATPIQPVQSIPAMSMGMGMGIGISGGVPIVAGNNGQTPDVSGLGRTPAEETIRQLNFAHSNKMFEPQDFKPADDDPSRFYYVREVDGNWTQRNRFTIDHLGDCRWYVTDEGWFYAVRMPN